MNEKKTLGRGSEMGRTKRLVIALAALCLIFIIVTGGTIIYYSGVMNDKEVETSNLHGIINSNQIETAKLHSIMKGDENEIANLHSIINNGENETANLQSIINSVENSSEIEIANLHSIINSDEAEMANLHTIINMEAAEIAQLHSTINSKDEYANGLSQSLDTANSQVSNLTSENNYLLSQIANPTGLIPKETEANLFSYLNAKDIIISSKTYLYISGSVVNTGFVPAYNAGLHVIAYNVNGSLAINMTVPFYGTFGNGENTVGQFQTVYQGQISNVYVNVFHEGNLASWNVTSTWTNSP